MGNLHLLYRHSPSGWDQLTRTESEPSNTGPFPILFTHNPTWDDCQQLLQVLFNTEERERILAEAQKRVPGVDGRPTTQPHLVDEGFPLLRPNWDFERVEGRRDRALGSLQSRAASHPRRTGEDASRMGGDSPRPSLLICPCRIRLKIPESLQLKCSPQFSSSYIPFPAFLSGQPRFYRTNFSLNNESCTTWLLSDYKLTEVNGEQNTSFSTVIS
ncbi:uncharacterized protein LOC122684622 [Cervus elaphus]|uniref:uncharacterized protein LOC122684622 n=1 Tax=Cervus elaphus TaxID=9860 RepID=UPI001CC2F317|nr:uncharacterized protein LOC122684622 [Cervus elaphus]